MERGETAVTGDEQVVKGATEASKRSSTKSLMRWSIALQIEQVCPYTGLAAVTF